LSGSRHGRRLARCRCESEKQRDDVSGGGGGERTSTSSPSSSGSGSGMGNLPPEVRTADLLLFSGGNLPSRRRLLLGTSLASATALGANFLGITSTLLGLDGGQLARKYRLDTLYAVKGFRRSLDLENGFTFVFPSDWLADQTLYRRYARRVEQMNALDPPPLKNRKRASGPGDEPVAAYGPPGSTGELNVSVIAAPIEPGFTLQKLGTPGQAGQLILDSFIAPSSQQDKTAELISARETRDENDTAYYLLEYAVRSASKGWRRRNLAVYGTNPDSGLLYTLNVQCPEEQFERLRPKLTQIATSFQILL